MDGGMLNEFGVIGLAVRYRLQAHWTTGNISLYRSFSTSRLGKKYWCAPSGAIPKKLVSLQRVVFVCF